MDFPERFKGVHTDFISVGKCNICKCLRVWSKKESIKLSEAFCIDCNNKLERTTFLSKLPIKDNRKQD